MIPDHTFLHIHSTTFPSHNHHWLQYFSQICTEIVWEVVFGGPLQEEPNQATLLWFWSVTVWSLAHVAFNFQIPVTHWTLLHQARILGGWPDGFSTFYFRLHSLSSFHSNTTRENVLSQNIKIRISWTLITYYQHLSSKTRNWTRKNYQKWYRNEYACAAKLRRQRPPSIHRTPYPKRQRPNEGTFKNI